MTANKPSRILIVGAGALGSYYAGKLSQAGAQVSVVSRSDYDHVREHGIRIDSIYGDFHFTPHRVLAHTSEYPEEADYVVLTTKVLPDIDPVSLLSPVVSPRTTIVLIQNGIFIEQALAQAFPDHPIISTLAFLGSHKAGPGHIQHTSFGHLRMGLYPHGQHDAVTLLSDLFNQGGVECKVSDTIQKERWRKMMWNIPFNPMSVVAGGVTTADLLRDAEPLVRAVMEETRLLARHEGYDIHPETIQNLMTYTADMGDYKTSMLLDKENGRDMEIDAIIGRPIAYAREHQISVPHMETLHYLLTCNVNAS